MIFLGRKYLREQWDEVRGLHLFSRVSKKVSKTGEIPFVLVHGLGVCSRYMTPLANELAREHRGYVPDLPGYGRSQRPKRVLNIRELAEHLRDWLRAVGIEHAVCVGNSMGCQVIVELADLAPSYVKAAVLLGPTMDQTAKSRLSHVVGLFMDQFREPPTLVPLQAFDYLSNGPLRTIHTFQNAVKHDMLTRVIRLRVPCLVLRGEHDEIVSQVWIEELVRRMPRAKAQTIPDAGHALNYNAAAVVAPLIMEFCRRWGISLEPTERE